VSGAVAIAVTETTILWSSHEPSEREREREREWARREAQEKAASGGGGETKKKDSSSSSAPSTVAAAASSSSDSTPSPATPAPLSRDDPLSWTNIEKQQLFRAIQIYGKQWDRITSMVGSRTQSQVEGFYKKYKIKLNLQEMVNQAEDMRRGAMKQSPSKGRNKR
jgi:hypothetical protein